MVVAAWSDSDTSSSETDDEKSEERANICLMAQEDETEVIQVCIVLQRNDGTSSEHKLLVSVNETVQQLKQKVYTTLRYEVERQDLSYNGERLQDNRTINQCRIGNGAKIILTLKTP
ncbi:Ubiquitin-like domain - like 10 [Theobroma cacao]|nr:Ubiquitin-like domain - like 10 [Theobroma cacao]